MSTAEMRKRLIDKILHTDNNALLEEAIRLLELDTEKQEVFTLSSEQNAAIAEARGHAKAGRVITEKDADKEIDEWLKQ